MLVISPKVGKEDTDGQWEERNGKQNITQEGQRLELVKKDLSRGEQKIQGKGYLENNHQPPSLKKIKSFSAQKEMTPKANKDQPSVRK